MMTVKKKWMAMLLCAAMTVCVLFSGTVRVSASEETEEAEDTEEGLDMVVCLGADLSSSQRAAVLELLGLSESDLTDDNVVYITNEDEHNYLDEYLSSDVIGSNALSSAVITKAEDGAGLSITTENISYCTISMYQNALATAGAQDVTVKIAGPTSISGTAALVGVMLAYSKMTGEEVNEDALDAACEEITTTGDVAESTGDSEGTEELIAAVKEAVIESGLTDADEIEEVIRNAADQIGLELSDEDIQSIITLMQKLSELDLDIDQIKQQASDIYDAISEKGYDLGITKEAALSLVEKIANWFSKILSFFKN